MTMNSVTTEVLPPRTLFGTIWHAVGYELVIFVLTLVFALVWQKLAGRALVNKKKHVDPIYTREDPGKLHASAETPLSNLRKPTSLAEDLEELVSSFQEQPRVGTATRVLKMYKELSKSSISEITKHSKCSAQEVYTLVVQCAIRVGKCHLLDEILDDMAKQGVPRTLHLYENIMKYLAGQKQYQAALSMYDRLVADDLEPSCTTCSCLINFAAEVGELHRAIGFFERLSSMTTPSIRAYMTLLRVHAKRQDWPATLATMHDMQRRGVAIDSLAFNIALATGVTAEQMEAAEALMAEFDTKEVPILDTVSYNTLLKGYAHQGKALKAVEVIDRMRTRGLQPTGVTFNTALDAIVRSGNLTEAWEFLKVAHSWGFSNDKFTSSILVKGLIASPEPKHIQNCLALVDEVATRCDSSLKNNLYQIMLNASVQASDPAVLTSVFAQLWKHDVVPTAVMYKSLVHALQEKGTEAHCNLVLKQMLSAKVRPPVATLISLLNSYLSKGHIASAISAFNLVCHTLKNDSNGPKVTDLAECYMAFIRALCHVPCPDEATLLYAQASQYDAACKLDFATAMILARLQSDAGSTGAAWITLKDMMEIGHKPSHATLNSFLIACMKNQDIFSVSEFLRLAASHDITLTPSSYLQVFRVYTRCNQLLAAIALFEGLVNGKDNAPGLLQDILDILASALKQRGPLGAADLQKLRQLASKHGLSLKA